MDNQNEKVLQAVASGTLIDFIPLPSDATQLTEEQLNALFPPQNQIAFCKQLARIVMDSSIEKEE